MNIPVKQVPSIRLPCGHIVDEPRRVGIHHILCSSHNVPIHYEVKWGKGAFNVRKIT